jgi:hypothetical protein
LRSDANLAIKQACDAGTKEIGELHRAAPGPLKLGGEVGERFEDVEVVDDRVEEMMGGGLMLGLTGFFNQGEGFED